MQTPRCIVAALVALLMAAATPVIADPTPFTVYFTPRVYWIPDFPFVPSTLSAETNTSTDARGEIDFESFSNVDPLADNPTSFPSNGGYPLMINPGETISWSLTGSIAFGDLTIPFCAYADSASPPDPCQPIPIATLLSAHWGTLHASGPVFAFSDGPVQIGTWDVFSDERFIPEPAVFALVGVGLAGLAASRRRKLI